MLQHVSGTTPAAGVHLAATAQPLSSTQGGFLFLPVQCLLQGEGWLETACPDLSQQVISMQLDRAIVPRTAMRLTTFTSSCV